MGSLGYGLVPDDIKSATINATSDGDNTVIAAVAGKRIRVLAYVLTTTAAAADIIFKSATTELGRLVTGAAGGGAVYDGGPDRPAFTGGTNEAFIVNNPAGVDSKGHVTYILV